MAELAWPCYVTANKPPVVFISAVVSSSSLANPSRRNSLDDQD